jgi:hypothetical protein
MSLRNTQYLLEIILKNDDLILVIFTSWCQVEYHVHISIYIFFFSKLIFILMINSKTNEKK